MGYFGHWVVARGASRSALRRLRLEARREECAPGWRYAYGESLPDDLDRLVERAAQCGDGAAVGAWVFDSDYAQVVAVVDGRRAAVAIGPEAAEEPLGHDPDAFAAWSACAPRPLTAAEVDQIAHRDDVFAEETVDELLDRLGLPAPYDPLKGSTQTRQSVGAGALGGYLAPLGTMRDATFLAGVRVPWRELRHVPGLGDGFLGLWDREAPGEPISTFPVSSRGQAALDEELGRLQRGDRRRILRAEQLDGFLEPLDALGQIRVAGRDLSYRDARFVPGRGEDFIGIWDRRRPGDPIERFRPGRAGELAAVPRLHALTFEHELGAKHTPGVRLCLHGGRTWFVVEEDEDERWSAHGAGRFLLYEAPGEHEELSVRGQAETAGTARAWVARDEPGGKWLEVPATVPRTLLATLRWAQREFGGGAKGPWFERFDWAAPGTRVEPERSFTRVYDGGEPTAVVLCGQGHAEGAAAYLLRPGDAPRFLYSLDDPEVLRPMLANYLGDVELGEWRMLPDEWPSDLEKLAPAVLAIAGLA